VVATTCEWNCRSRTRHLIIASRHCRCVYWQTTGLSVVGCCSGRSRSDRLSCDEHRRASHSAHHCRDRDRDPTTLSSSYHVAGSSHRHGPRKVYVLRELPPSNTFKVFFAVSATPLFSSLKRVHSKATTPTFHILLTS